MSIDKQALHERYSPQPIPKCHICGAEMTVQRMSASRVTYGCTGATYDDKGCHYAEGRSIADDHYEQSRVTIVDVSDPDVLALLDELEAAEKRIAELEKLTEAESTGADKAAACGLEWMKRCLVAEKRKAELEAIFKSVKFDPIPMDELGNKSDGKKHPYMFGAGYNSAVVRCESVLLQAFAAAGIGKGE